MEDKLSVKTICQLTGINEHTLRAWERRYSVVRPKRLDNGRRVYSIKDLEKLKLIALLIRKGFLIGNIANQSLQDLSSLLNEASQSPDLDDLRQKQQTRAEEITLQLEGAITHYQLVKINLILQQVKAEYGIREYLFEVVLPLMARVGDAVARQEFSIGQEHALSAIVKYHLLQVFYLLSHSHAIINDARMPKTFAIATTEGNLHEFGILIAAVLCAFHGYPVYYLGPNMPADALAEAAAALGANSLILGLPPYEHQEEVINLYLDRLFDDLPEVCEVWLGGSPNYGKPEKLDRIRMLPSLEELDRMLANIKRV